MVEVYAPPGSGLMTREVSCCRVGEATACAGTAQDCSILPPPLNKRHARCQLLTGELFAATPGLRFLLDLQRDSVQYSCPNQTKALGAHKFYSKINATSLESNMSISTKEKIYDIDILVF